LSPNSYAHTHTPMLGGGGGLRKEGVGQRKFNFTKMY